MTQKRQDRRFDKQSAFAFLGEDVAMGFMAAGDTESTGAWWFGDMALATVEAKAKDASPAVVDAAIAVVAGVSAARVADLRSVAEFYPAEVRTEYAVCSHSHFRAAKSAGDLDSAERWLQECVESMDEFGGVVMPVDKLRALMSEQGANADAELWQKRLRVLQNNAEKMLFEEDGPADVLVAVAGFLEALANCESQKPPKEPEPIPA